MPGDPWAVSLVKHGLNTPNGVGCTITKRRPAGSKKIADDQKDLLLRPRIMLYISNAAKNSRRCASNSVLGRDAELEPETHAMIACSTHRRTRAHRFVVNGEPA
jgi:hypothetical protein